MFSVPDLSNVRKCIITEETIREARPPLLLTQAEIDRGVDETNYTQLVPRKREGRSA
jgi:ATP-dependent protease Clp ATPase subunit